MVRDDPADDDALENGPGTDASAGRRPVTDGGESPEDRSTGGTDAGDGGEPDAGEDAGADAPASENGSDEASENGSDEASENGSGEGSENGSGEGGGNGSGEGSENGSDEDGDRAPPGSRIDRRTLIRILVAIGLGIPILIEARTLLGLIVQNLGGDGGETTTTTRTTTSGPGPVGPGDELLPETPQTERVTEGYVLLDDSPQFSLTIDIDNQSDTEYELRLEGITTTGGKTIDGDASSGRLAPGDDGSVTGTWDLPPGERPTGVQVIAISIPQDGSATTVDRTVELGAFPVER